LIGTSTEESTRSSFRCFHGGQTAPPRRSVFRATPAPRRRAGGGPTMRARIVPGRDGARKSRHDEPAVKPHQGLVKHGREILHHKGTESPAVKAVQHRPADPFPDATAFLGPRPTLPAATAITVSEDGRLICENDSTARLAFTFICHDIPYSGTAVTEGVRCRVAITGDIGPLPYSTQSAAARRGILALMAESARNGRCRLALAAEQRMAISAWANADLPLTDRSLIVAVSECLVAVVPVLDRLAHILDHGARDHVRRLGIDAPERWTDTLTRPATWETNRVGRPDSRGADVRACAGAPGWFVESDPRRQTEDIG